MSVVLFSGAFAVYGQTSNAPEPDYSNVSDILDGQRTLLRDDDLSMTAFVSQNTNPSSGTIAGTIVNTANGKVSVFQPTTAATPVGDDRIHKVFSGRFYDLDHDLSLRAIPLADNAPFVLLTDASNGLNTFALPNGKRGDATFSAALGDFNGDGYADFVVNYGPPDVIANMVILSGANPDGSPNWHFGPVRTRADGQETLLAMTTGDFDGDGRIEIAGFAYKNTGRFVLEIYKVDPATLAISKVAELMPTYAGEDPTQPIAHYSMASGHFTSATHNQVALTYATTLGHVKIAIYDFANGSLQPVEKSVYATNSSFAAGNPLTQLDGVLQVETGKFSLVSPYDQLFFGFAWKVPVSNHGDGTRYFAIFEVDPSNETLLLKSLVDFSEFTCTSTFSVGNYDKKTTDSSGKTQPAFGLQVAIAVGACDTTSDKTLRIYGVNPLDYNSTTDYTGTLPTTLNTVACVHAVSRERRLSRFLYTASKPANPGEPSTHNT